MIETETEAEIERRQFQINRPVIQNLIQPYLTHEVSVEIETDTKIETDIETDADADTDMGTDTDPLRHTPVVQTIKVVGSGFPGVTVMSAVSSNTPDSGSITGFAHGCV